MTLVKTKAPAASNDDRQKATMLSKMALNKLNMQAPELGKHVVAFKDLTAEMPDDTGIQCGMIILEISGNYLYVPVIGKLGEVQPLETIFNATDKTFIPLTKKTVEGILTGNTLLGAAERIPRGVARDPDLYDAIVPPKTGKFVYASEGRLGGFLATLPGHHKKAVLEVITNDEAFQDAVVPVMKLDIVKEYLNKDTPEYVAPAGPPAPEVITSGEGLDEDQVQEVLAKGYIVKNPPKSKRIAVESDPDQALTTLSVLDGGRAYSAMKKNGDWVSVAGIRMVPQGTEDSATMSGSRMSSGDTSVVGVTEEGNILTNPRIVICNGEVSYDDVMERLSNKRLTDVRNDEYGMIFTGAAWMGPVCICNVQKSNGWTNIEAVGDMGDRCNINIHPNINSLYNAKGNDKFLSTSAMFYPMKNEGDDVMERDINTAQCKIDIQFKKMLPVEANLMHRNGVYAVDGREVGGKPEIVEHLLNHWAIDVPTVETFTKSAEEKGSIMVKMAALRQGGRSDTGSGTRVQPIYEHGLKREGDEPITGNARQRAIGMATRAKKVKDVGDRQVMEATIISEMLQNPDLSGSIREYLPEIKEAVDKLGRSLFLMRLNTTKLNESIDTESLNNLFTATRNAYRILGENVLQLEKLISSTDG